MTFEMDENDRCKPGEEKFSFYWSFQNVTKNVGSLTASSGRTSKWDFCLHPSSSFEDVVITVQFVGEKKLPNIVEFNFTFKNSDREVVYSMKEIKENFGMLESSLKKSFKWSDLFGKLINNILMIEVDITANFADNNIGCPRCARITSKMQSLLKDTKFTNFVIQVEETDIPVHRCILGTASPVFEKFFRIGTSEVKYRRKEIKDLPLRTVRAMIEFIYTGVVDDPSDKLIFDLLKASDLYAVIDLQDWCCHYLMQNLRVTNAVDIFVAAHDFNNKQLKEKCLNFIVENRKAIGEKGKIQKVLEQRKDLANELLLKMWC